MKFVTFTTDAILSDMGMEDDSLLAEQMYRVAQKVDSRVIYDVTTIDGTRSGLTGRLLAIYDLENLELTLLTTGDAFESSGCE